jgi:hypothetical protein
VCLDLRIRRISARCACNGLLQAFGLGGITYLIDTASKSAESNRKMKACDVV